MNYKFGFDIWGLVLFLLVIVPTFIWAALPAPDDVLRAELTTPVVDAIASVLQILTVACLCVEINKNADKSRFSSLVILSAV